MNSFQVRKTDFETIYDKYSSMLYRLALTHVQTKEDAEDVVHDVFAKYLEAAHKLKDDEHERAWLVRVTVNKCHDLIRKRKYRMHMSLDDIHELPKEEKALLPDVFEVVATLPEKYKTVIVLHYLEGYSVEEISSMLRVSGSAVKMRLSRGRELLKNILEKEENNV